MPMQYEAKECGERLGLRGSFRLRRACSGASDVPRKRSTKRAVQPPNDHTCLPSIGLTRSVYGGIGVLVLILLGGCEIGSERMSPLEMKARDLEREKTQLAGQLEQCQVEAQQLKAQIQTLAALPQNKPENHFYALSAVKINRFTDFYDKNEDGKRDKLIVYLQPVDQAGDAIKTAGVVSVQLWNLNQPDGQAVLGQWQVLPGELHKLWFNTLTSTAYRLTFDVTTTPAMLAQPLTVRTTFTDYLTGQVFTDQYIIQPRTDTLKQ